MKQYSNAGVDLITGDGIKSFITESIRSTYGPNVVSAGGEFGGVYSIPGTDICSVSSIDGVGTKLKVAILADSYMTVGQDLVNHSINDIGVMGANPGFFMDYLAFEKLETAVVSDIIQGLVIACKRNNVALIGGETAQMPGIYKQGDFDLAGVIVGFVNRNELINGEDIKPGDHIFAFPSNGLHTNGYSLARKIIFENMKWSVDTHNETIGRTWGEELLRIHRCYLTEIRSLKNKTHLKGLAHITGGGIPGNLSRIVPDGMSADIDCRCIQTDPVFKVLQEAGNVGLDEMYDVFNMGVGMVFIIPEEEHDIAYDLFGDNIYFLGRIISESNGRKISMITE